MKYIASSKSNFCNDFLCSESFSYNNYDKIASVPIYNLTKDQFFLKKSDYLTRETRNKVVYLYFEIFCEDNMDILLTMYGNHQKIKVWINGEYNGYSSEWIKRKIIFGNKGINEIYCELVEPDFDKILFYIKDAKPQKNYIIDDYNDIKNNYIIYEKHNTSIRLCVLNDNCKKKNIKNEVKIITPIIDYEKRKIRFKKIDHFIVDYGKEFIIECSNYEKLCQYKWIFIEFEFQRIRVFLSDPLEAKKILLSEIKKNMKFFSDFEYKNIIRINKIYSKRDDLSDGVKYYFLYGELVKILSRTIVNSKKEHIKNYGYKEIEFISKLDNKKTIYGLYIPKDIEDKRDINLIIIFSSNSYNTYIESFQKYFHRNYIIVEFNLRGNNHGNTIGEFIFFEILEKIKKIFRSNHINNIYLFGYSSCASAVVSIAGKYPYLFSGCLAIAGKLNQFLLKNINNYVDTILLYGDQDIDIVDTYFDNLKTLEYNNGKVKNILLNGYDHTTISCFMRNKLLLSKILNFKKKESKIIKYFGISESYFPNEKVEILKRYDKQKPYYIEIEEKKELFFIYSENVEILKLNLNSKKNVNINGIKNSICNNVIYKINKNECSLIHSFDYTKINNGMGIINIYSSSIVFWIHNLSDLDTIYGFYKPKNMTRNPHNEIEYTYRLVSDKNELDLNDLKKQNNVFYNSKINSNTTINIFFDEIGFSYMGRRYDCKYSIIQICKYNCKYYNLYINDNNLACSKKNFFLRNVFIPSEVYNVKSIYTSCAIIFMKNKYYHIDEFGNEMKEYY